MINSSNLFRPEIRIAPAVSTLTTDPVLQQIFRRLEDDGAAEVLPMFRPRPIAPAAVRVRELVEA